MSLIRRALGAGESRALPAQNPIMEQAPGYGQPGFGWWDDGMIWRPGSGSASPEQAMRLSAVYGCLRLLSEAIATLPLHTFRSTEVGVRAPYPTPRYLEFRPPQGSRIVYLSQVMLSLLTDGNAFVHVARDGMSAPTELHVLDPTLVTVGRDREGWLEYRVQGVPEPYGPLDIMHIPGMMLPGQLRGMSPIGYAREVIDASRKAQTLGSQIMGNHGVPPAVIEVPPSVGPVSGSTEQEKAQRLARAFRQSNSGGNAGKVAVLTGGATLKSIAVKPEDMQWLDSKRFGVSEIARFFGVPPHLIADATGSTSWGSGLAEQNVAFGAFSLQPWTERIDDGHTRLMASHEPDGVFAKLNLDAKLRSSPKDRAETMDVQIGNRTLTVNEARALEDRPPVPWGDDFVWADAMAGREPPSDEPMTSRQLAEAVQKIYLGVGKVLTAAEAREILNREGAGLTGPGPEVAP